MNLAGKKLNYYLYDQVSKRFLPIESGIVCGRNQGQLTFPKDEMLSRSHCEFIVTDSGVYLRDLNSTNQTKLNSARIQPGFKRKLQLNDLIEFGQQRLILTNQNSYPPGYTQDVFPGDRRHRLRRATTQEQLTSVFMDTSELRMIKLKETIEKMKRKPVTAACEVTQSRPARSRKMPWKLLASVTAGLLLISAAVAVGYSFGTHTGTPEPIQKSVSENR